MRSRLKSDGACLVDGAAKEAALGHAAALLVEAHVLRLGVVDDGACHVQDTLLEVRVNEHGLGGVVAREGRAAGEEQGAGLRDAA